MQKEDFKEHIWQFYRQAKRELPWRNTQNPYKILVSEIMLQQTQVDRVIPKYTSWLGAFPTITDLADAPLKEVLTQWQGLGYNRRGLNLKKSAQKIVEEHGGTIPQNQEALLSLPGIGPYTAGALQAFAWNKPVVMIETNIRTVFIHHFFDKDDVHDKEIRPLIEETLDRDNPRKWYWALMDYGSHLKQKHPNPSRKSKHHSKQSTFEGSNRQLRSQILKYILANGPVSKKDVLSSITSKKWSVEGNLVALEQEGFIINRKGKLTIPE